MANNDFELLYSYQDTTYHPSLGFIVASQIGLALFFVMLFSFVDIRKRITMQKRLWLLGVSVFGLLQFGSIFSEYKIYQLYHNAFIKKSNLVIEGEVSNFKENNRGLETFYIKGIKMEFDKYLHSEIKEGDSVRIEYFYNSYWKRNEILKFERRKNNYR
jgi:hypothetical protein